MKRRDFSKNIAVTAAAHTIPKALAANVSRKPNIIYILAADLGCQL